MKNILKLALITISVWYAGLNGALHAQGYVVNAQITGQAVGDGTYNYTILLKNDSSSQVSIGTFWFAWVPDDYGYDLLASEPTVTQLPGGWSPYINYGNYYYPDGYSIEFYNSSGSPLAPGGSYTFGFNSADSPATLLQNSPYDSIPTLTSYVYSGYAFGDPGAEFLVTPTAVPEPSIAALLGICATSLLFATKCRVSFLKQPIPPNQA